MMRFRLRSTQRTTFGCASPQRGAVLLLALFALAGLVGVGVMLLEVSVLHHAAGATGLDRVRARALADGGLQVGHRRLLEDATFVGTLAAVVLKTGQVEVEVQAVDAVHRDILATGKVGGVQVALVQRVAIEPQTSDQHLLHTLYLPGSIRVDDPTLLKVDGTIVLGQALDRRDAAVFEAVSIQEYAEPVPVIQVDPTAAELASLINLDLGGGLLSSGLATLKLTGESTLTALNLVNQNIYCTGTLTLRDGCTVHGTVVALGGVIVKGGGSDVRFLPPAGQPAIVAGAAVEFDHVGSLEVLGSICAAGDVRFDKVADLAVHGSLFAGGSVHFKKIELGYWRYDPAVMSAPPPGVTSLLAPEVRPIWTRPHTAAP